MPFTISFATALLAALLFPLFTGLWEFAVLFAIAVVALELAVNRPMAGVLFLVVCVFIYGLGALFIPGGWAHIFSLTPH